MDLFSIFTFINLIAPIIVTIGTIKRYRLTRRVGVLVILPAFVYMFFFYAVVVYLEHFSIYYDPAVFRSWFRLGFSLVNICFIISIYTDIFNLRRLINGRNNKDG